MSQESNTTANTVRKIAWGYFFLYLDINLNSWSVLPAWLGWYKFSSAIGALKEKRPKLALLENFLPPLLVWSLLEWQQFFALPAWTGPVRVMLELMELYFHFHLLTELSALASGALAQRLLRCRTASLVMETAMIGIIALPLPQEILGWMAVPLLLARALVCLYIMLSIFSLAKELEEAPAEN